MDIDLKNRLVAALEQVRQLTGLSPDINQLDPVQHMMLVALLNECQKIMDYVDGVSERIAQHFAEDFVPRRSIAAMPAIALLGLSPRQRVVGEPVFIGPECTFKATLGQHATSELKSMDFAPIFKTLIVNYSDICLVSEHQLRLQGKTSRIDLEQPNQLYVGITMPASIDSLQGLSLLLSGTHGIVPDAIGLPCTGHQLSFTTMNRMEDIEMLEPFDAQQSSGRFFAIIESWKEQLLDLDDGALLYITDDICDRDAFKPRAYPRAFQHCMELETLEQFDERTLWLRLDFAPGYRVPDDCRLDINVVAVTNVAVNHVTLTASQPIVKLQKQEGDYYLDVVESSTKSQQQGFAPNAQEFVVRDFDAACYNNGDLYREVRNLYNRFVDDYYAFIEYNDIKDGETIRTLRSTLNRLGKSVKTDNRRYRFDSGTYALRNIANEDHDSGVSQATRVTFLTTNGSAGNRVTQGMTMECRRAPAIEPRATVLVGGMGGCDKATADQRYELLRFHCLTNDRLFTRMDIDAFLRKEVISVFGRDEFKRIGIRLTVQGATGEQGLVPGLYADIEFRDRGNYERAVSLSLATLLEQRIARKSCLLMPVTVHLVNLEQ
ncbi:MAG: hypothetical protein IJ613_08220 [Muribaculaceae bacterium]|nr:hypothetical protein [Muribaculaceae bacterium]